MTWRHALNNRHTFGILGGLLPPGQYYGAWPGWPTLSFNSQDPFPWALVADVAATMGDNARAATYITSIQNKYVSSGFPWPFYPAEGGWYMRANSYMLGHGL